MLRSLDCGARHEIDAESAELDFAFTTPRLGEHFLDGICLEHGDRPYGALQRAHVVVLRNKRAAKGPAAADGLVKALSALYAWALKHDLVDRNPCAGIDRLAVNGDGFATWTITQVEQFEAVHLPGSMPWIALRVFLYAGLRRGDAARLGPANLFAAPHPDTAEVVSWFRIRPEKTARSSGALVEVPVHPKLAEAIAHARPGTKTFISTFTGAQFTTPGLGNAMRRWCDDAKLPDVSAHGLRKLAATIAAENGATHEQLKALFGWSNFQQADHYVKQAQRRKVAGSASRLLVI